MIIQKEKMRKYYTPPEFFRLIQGESLMKRSMRSINYDVQDGTIPTTQVMGKKVISKDWIIKQFYNGIEPDSISMIKR